MNDDWPEDVLTFWFDELTPEDWYTGKEEIDAAIRARFLPLYETMKRDQPRTMLSEPRAALAAIIVFDQFPRNIFRRQPAAFGTDQLAMGLSSNAVDRGFDDGMSMAQKQFMYMPFMHSEVLADQERSVMLFGGLGNEDSLKYAIEHRDIVARFGRFPHRNRVLGRESSAEEEAFLKEHAGYGQ
ncbi:DUF924 family protein [Nitratireductor soli]|uniref:DUF924 family protein n=1 Tax=Nitratireductor soli TaxID=1670619 RepID=UPI00065E3C6E|nr:DUF924 family protein [Nitratireductor soli]